MSKRNLLLCLSASGLAIVLTVIALHNSGSEKRGGQSPGKETAANNLAARKTTGADSEALSTLLKKAKSAEDVRFAAGKLQAGQLGTLENGNAFREIVDSWFENGAEHALTLISSLPREYRYSAFKWGERFYVSEPRLFLNAAATSLSPSQASSIGLRVFVALGRTDPQKANELIQAEGQGESKVTHIQGMYAAWAEVDPKAALVGLASLPFPEDREHAYRAIFEQIAQQGGAYYPLIEQADIPEELKGQIGEGLLRAVSEKGGADKLIELYRTNPSLAKYGNAAVAVMVQREGAAFSKNLEKHIADGLVVPSRDAEAIGFGLAGNSREDALQFFNNMPWDAKGGAAVGISKQLARTPENRAVLSDMIGSLKDESQRAAAAAPLIEVLKREGKIEELRSLEAQIHKK